MYMNIYLVESKSVKHTKLQITRTGGCSRLHKVSDVISFYRIITHNSLAILHFQEA